MALEVRNVATDEEFNAWCDAMDVGFYNPKWRGDGPNRRSRYSDLTRLWAGFDGSTIASTFVSFDLVLTLPGGAELRLDAISGVTVAPTHRRRGLASRMMSADLAQAKERGYAVAGLIAAEYPIYGRFGFGAATEAAQWTLDARDAAFRCALPGTIEFVEPVTARDEASALWDRIREDLVGAVSREPWRWDLDTGLNQREGFAPKDVLHALCRDSEGRVTGYVAYRHVERWTNQRPDNDIIVQRLIAQDPFYEARLWQFLAEHDWTSRVIGTESDWNDPLWRDLLVNRRAASSANSWDFTWLRVLDPVAALSARTYAHADRIVLRVEDKDGYAEGTYSLEVAEDGTATCVPTHQSADVVVPVDRLGSIYLGGFTAARLGALGLIDELTPGAVGRLSALFALGIAPHNPMIF
jgi:predicted acetyltransferase